MSWRPIDSNARFVMGNEPVLLYFPTEYRLTYTLHPKMRVGTAIGNGTRTATHWMRLPNPPENK